MGPIVAIPGRALMMLRRAKNAERALAKAPLGYVVDPMPHTMYAEASKLIGIANDTRRTRTIASWMRKTGRR